MDRLDWFEVIRDSWINVVRIREGQANAANSIGRQAPVDAAEAEVRLHLARVEQAKAEVALIDEGSKTLICAECGQPADSKMALWVRDKAPLCIRCWDKLTAEGSTKDAKTYPPDDIVHPAADPNY